MSEKYKLLKYYYDVGLWTSEMLKNGVRKKYITRAEYEQITGEEYVE